MEFVTKAHLHVLLPVVVSLGTVFSVIDKFSLILDRNQRRKGLVYAIGALIYAALCLYNQFQIHVLTNQQLMTVYCQ